MQKASPTAIQKDAPEISSNLPSTTATHPTDSQSPTHEEDPDSELAKRKVKYGSKWKQQRLFACRQNFNLLHILVLYVSLGVVFLVIGGLCFYYGSNYPVIIEMSYTECAKNYTGEDVNPNGLGCFPDRKDGINFTQLKTSHCSCQLKIEIEDKHLPAVGRRLVLFYELRNYYQNIRQYRKDVDWAQLGGHAITTDGEARIPDCKLDKNIKKPDKPTFPCGKIVNSYFSDDFKMYDDKGEMVKLDESKIAWEEDMTRFKNPTSEQLNGRKILDIFKLPLGWHTDLTAEFLKPESKGVENEHFVVWMRAAALKDFRKKYAYINLPGKGEYTIDIQYRYEVKSFNGEKKIVIATDCQDRPVDLFFFYWYVSVGGICMLTGPLIYITSRVMKSFTYSAIHKKSSSSKRAGSRQGSVTNNAGDNQVDPSQLELQDQDHPAAHLTGHQSSLSVKA